MTQFFLTGDTLSVHQSCCGGCFELHGALGVDQNKNHRCGRSETLSDGLEYNGELEWSVGVVAIRLWSGWICGLAKFGVARFGLWFQHIVV